MRTKIFILGLLFAVLCFYSLGYSEVPQMINYQGKLTKPVTGALVDTTVTVRFAIYGDTLGEPSFPFWSETESVKVETGVFSVLLGSVNPIPDTVFTGAPRYLAIKIGNDPEMKPLQFMASVPYAMYASKFLDGEGDGDWFVNGNDMYSIPSGKVGIGTTAPTAGLDVKHSSNTEYALKVYNSGGQALGVEVTGGANSATPLLNVHSGNSGGDRQGLWVQSYGNVGIGTTNPQGLLQVGEPFIVTSDEDVGISHPGSPEYTPDAKLEIVTDAVKDFLMLSSTNANSANGDRFIVKNDGNVGIGTATPNNKLTVFQKTDVQASTYPGAEISVRQMYGEPEYGHPEKNYALELNDRSTGSTAGVAMKLSSGNGPIANIYSTANAVGQGGSLVFQTSPDHSNLYDRVTIGRTGNVGIGTTTPMNKLDVEGGVAVGTGYSGTNTAPTNGMIVEGNVGIGTTVPAAKLHIGDPFTPGPAPSNIGVLAKIAGPTSPALGSATKWGMVGYAETGGVLGSGNMYGIYGITYGTDNLSVGVYGEGGGGASWAGKFGGKVYAAQVAIGTTTPMNKLDVEGSVAVGAGYSGTNTAPTNGMIVEGNVGIGTTSPDTKLTVKGNGVIFRGYDASNQVIVEIGSGFDYSETFPISQEDVTPGMVMVIDPANKGNLAMSTEAYDSKVAGIIAGANGLGSGVRLGSRAEDAGQHAVALAGRVYCNVDTKYGDIKPGDLLTTSPTPGHAMVVKDFSRANGAILGKAMEGLSGGGKGQILVLVTLQ